MRTYQSESVAGHATAGKGKKRKKLIIISGALALVLIPMAAYAAVLLFGFGSFTANAATPGTLTVVDGTSKLTNTLAPGQTVGVKGNVQNANDYPVTVTGLIVKNSSVKVTGGTQAECKVSFAGGTPTQYPNADGTLQADGTGTLFVVSPGVQVPATFTKEITLNNVLKQDATATKMCGVSADFAVRGQVGS